MKDALFTDSQRLREADILLNGVSHTFKFRPMSGKIHRLALEMSKKKRTIKEPDGQVIESEYYDDDRLRASIIYFQLLNDKEERVFNLPKQIDEIEEKISYETQSYLATLMGLKSVADMIEDQKEAIKKIIGQEP